MTSEVLYDGQDHEYPACPACGQRWKVSERAHTPHATPVDPPAGDRRHYLVVGPRAPLTQLPDTGAARLHLTWLCGDHTMTVAYPALDLTPCLAGTNGAACRGGQPLTDGGRYPAVHECRCCNHRGTHYVRRDGAHLPTCLRED